MDSIGENVMAIICVVVGILIIGCALVPIVENASTVETDTTATEKTSGFNTPRNTNESAWFGKVSELSIVANGNSITINGTPFTETGNFILSAGPGQGITYLLTATSNNLLRIYQQFDNELLAATNLTGTANYSNGVLTVSGTTEGNAAYEHSANVPILYTTYPSTVGMAPNTEIYAQMYSPFTIGEGQYATSNDGQTHITVDTTSMTDGTITQNDDGTITVTTTLALFAPYEWEGERTTGGIVTEDSEYAALYQMIPVLCILGMAYVLIRRFY